MRGAILASVLAASFVSAQNLPAEPICVTACLTSAISLAGCELGDAACQCGTGLSALQSAVVPCLLAACDQSDLQLAASIGLGVCSALAATAATTTPHNFPAVTTSGSSIPASTTNVLPMMTSAVATTGMATPSGTVKTSSVTSLTALAPESSNAAPVMMAGLGGLLGLGAAFFAAL